MDHPLVAMFTILQDLSQYQESSISVADSVLIQVSGDEDADKNVLLSWSYQDEELGGQLLQFLRNPTNILQ